MVGLLAVASAWGGPPASATWEVLQDGDVRVECTVDAAEPWCRATGHTTASEATVEAVIEDRAGYSRFYEHIAEARVLGEHLFYMRIDLPSPLSDRDQVVRTEKQDVGDVRVYSWTATTDPSAPETDAIRLVHAAGEWRLAPAKDGGTDLTYSWEAEMGGSMPGWILTRVRAGTGDETVRSTIAEAERRAKAP